VRPATARFGLVLAIELHAHVVIRRFSMLVTESITQLCRIGLGTVAPELIAPTDRQLKFIAALHIHFGAVALSDLSQKIFTWMHLPAPIDFATAETHPLKSYRHVICTNT
jgi:hypothetical protein